MIFKGNLNINPKYFIDKIDKGLSPTLYKRTFVRGNMTDYHYFVNDDECLSVLNQIDLPLNAKLGEAWGNRLDKGDWVQLHTHGSARLNQVVACCAIYLTDGGSETIFPDLNVKIKPTVGNYALFSPEVRHKVPINNSDTPRYTLIFNLVKDN